MLKESVNIDAIVGTTQEKSLISCVVGEVKLGLLWLTEAARWSLRHQHRFAVASHHGWHFC